MGLSTHVLDTARGRPAANMQVRLFAADGTELFNGRTNNDGRIPTLLGDKALKAGDYKLVFATQEYFQSQKLETFFPEVSIAFCITQASEHHHVPLLLSPFGFSTYRGS